MVAINLLLVIRLCLLVGDLDCYSDGDYQRPVSGSDYVCWWTIGVVIVMVTINVLLLVMVVWFSARILLILFGEGSDYVCWWTIGVVIVMVTINVLLLVMVVWFSARILLIFFGEGSDYVCWWAIGVVVVMVTINVLLLVMVVWFVAWIRVIFFGEVNKAFEKMKRNSLSDNEDLHTVRLFKRTDFYFPDGGFVTSRLKGKKVTTLDDRVGNFGSLSPDKEEMEKSLSSIVNVPGVEETSNVSIPKDVGVPETL
ncbi:hypothetical protein DM860_001968 [Cuscuta australis]|uniref:Uncharacterized protein n=1 Tax=Cuscuta australis TaxID=267555 RepID=A0A328DVD3_9ASTE|nr:hypothetical protein DM860_001968 [Cuscuta australis]